MAEVTTPQSTDHIWLTKLDASGRILLPADARLELGLSQGDELVLGHDASGMWVKTASQMAQEIQDYFATVWPKDRDVVSELLQERRVEAERDAGGD